MEGDFVERALLPLFRLGEPENPAFGVERRALPAKGFLAANCHQPVHELHSSRVKPFLANQRNRVLKRLSQIPAHIAAQNGTALLSMQCGKLRRAPSTPDHQLVIATPGIDRNISL
jgi:hypothetical protein